jgi:hypothetical protein
MEHIDLANFDRTGSRGDRSANSWRGYASNVCEIGLFTHADAELEARSAATFPQNRGTAWKATAEAERRFSTAALAACLSQAKAQDLVIRLGSPNTP